jgi:hypothetical protein
VDAKQHSELDIPTLKAMAANEIVRIYDRVAPGTYDKYAKPVDLLLAEGVRGLVEQLEALRKAAEYAQGWLSAGPQRDRDVADQLKQALDGSNPAKRPS